MRALRDRVVRPVNRSYNVLRLKETPLASRLRLLRAPRQTTAIALGRGTVWLEAPGAAIDLRTFDEIFVDEDYYSNEYRGAYVIDIGAHKGYYGVYASLRGARTVVSYEPEESNYRRLSDTAAQFRNSDFNWTVHRKAVGTEDGTASLQVSDESWAHSLETHASGGVEQRVDVVSMSSILEQAPADEKVVVKVDIEGMECDVVLGTSHALWQKAALVFVETHEFARCSADALASHLEAAGFNQSADKRGGILRVSRDPRKARGSRALS